MPATKLYLDYTDTNMARSLSCTLEGTCETIKGIFDSIKDDKSNSISTSGNVEKPHFFQLQNFWINLRIPVTSLRKEVAKLSILAATQPRPSFKEIEGVLATIEALALDVVTLSSTLPVSQGYWLQAQLKQSILSLGNSLVLLFIHMQQENSLQIQLTRTGRVIESCQAIIGLPKDNLETVLRIIEDEESMLADAAQEIGDEVKADKLAQVEEEVDNTSTWTNQDRELLPPCVGLIHTARATLKKLKKVLKEKGKCDCVENIAQLDAIGDAAQLLSPAVDEFVSAVYPPMTRSLVSDSALAVVSAVTQILELCQKSHWVGESDASWMSFLLRAVDHNNNKVQPLLNAF